MTLTFKNATQKTKYFQKILNKGVCTSLKTEREDDYNDMMVLFTEHPEYPEKLRDVVDIMIVRNKKVPKYYEFNLVRENGDIEDISYRCCITKRGKETDYLNAMRNAIEPQINYFRTISERECEICGSNNEIQIDHIYEFCDLVKDFQKTTSLDKPSIFNDNYCNMAIFKEEDKEYEKEWYIYHKDNAKLRPLCKRCNICRFTKRVHNH